MNFNDITSELILPLVLAALALFFYALAYILSLIYKIIINLVFKKKINKKIFKEAVFFGNHVFILGMISLSINVLGLAAATLVLKKFYLFVLISLAFHIFITTIYIKIKSIKHEKWGLLILSAIFFVLCLDTLAELTKSV